MLENCVRAKFLSSGLVGNCIAHVDWNCLPCLLSFFDSFTRSKTRSQRAEKEVRERSPIILVVATPEAVDEYAPSRDELIDRARNAVFSITSVAKKSKNLRGGVRSEISRATTEIQKAMDTL
ncbi:jg15156 [Pararge aegeria aegeria]|uniref:Jg15156 protein n=1 Tax=Pararge aegeria aegeria TaxID=348720 RepID=A0A8S4RYI8_9NEOP|nr:jg15156 [Pararge aegeria aegeria]